MYKVINQATLPSAASLSKLKKKGVNFDLLTNVKTLGQLTSITTGLLASVDPQFIKRDAYGNPFIVLNKTRISLAVAVTNCKSLLVIERIDNSQEFDNSKIDIIGSVGFGLSTWNSKVSAHFNEFKVKEIYCAEYLAIEHVSGDFPKVLIPIIIVVIDDDLGKSGMEITNIKYDYVTSKIRAFLDSYL
jgi:hypothetical protein